MTTIANDHATRPAAQVDRSLAELTVALFVAVQRADAARAAAWELSRRFPERLHALLAAEADKEVMALAEAHGLVKALIPYEQQLRDHVPEAFTARRIAERQPLAVVEGGRP